MPARQGFALPAEMALTAQRAYLQLKDEDLAVLTEWRVRQERLIATWRPRALIGVRQLDR